MYWDVTFGVWTGFSDMTDHDMTREGPHVKKISDTPQARAISQSISQVPIRVH